MNEKEKQDLIEKAMNTLRDFVMAKTEAAGLKPEYGESLWQKICQSSGLLQELAYYHDYGEFLCKYKVGEYTLADVLVWQVDHFKLYMDRGEDMNRYRKERLLLNSFETMAEMEKNPEAFAEKMRSETGQDIIPE